MSLTHLDAFSVSALCRGLPAPRLSYTGPVKGWAGFCELGKTPLAWLAQSFC